MSNPKPIWQSRTIYVLMIVAAVVQLPEVQAALPDSVRILAVAVAGAVMRIVSYRPLTLKGDYDGVSE